MHVSNQASRPKSRRSSSVVSETTPTVEGRAPGGLAELFLGGTVELVAMLE